MKTKERILRVASELIAEIGFHSATTALLATKTGIAEGTIYRHFQSKEDILATILTDLDERYCAFIALLKQEDQGDHGTLKRVLEAQFLFINENLDGIKIVLSSFALLPASKQSMTSVIDHMQNFIADALKSSMKKGVIRDVNPEHTASVLMALLLGLIELKLYWPQDHDINAEAVEFCRHALVKAL